MKIEYEGKAVEAPDLLVEIKDCAVSVNGEPAFKLPKGELPRIDVIGDIKGIEGRSGNHIFIVGNVGLAVAGNLLCVVGAVKSVKDGTELRTCYYKTFIGVGDEVKYCEAMRDHAPWLAERREAVLKVTDCQEGTLVLEGEGFISCVGKVGRAFSDYISVDGDVEVGKAADTAIHSEQRRPFDLLRAYNEMLINYNKKYAKRKTEENAPKKKAEKVEEKISEEKVEEKTPEEKVEEKTPEEKAEQRKFVIEATDAEGQKKYLKSFSETTKKVVFTRKVANARKFTSEDAAEPVLNAIAPAGAKQNISFACSPVM